jgi:transposase
VIKAAISHQVSAQELPVWIKNNGGIEEIKRKSVISDEALANREKRQAALDEVKATAETATINPLGYVEFSETFSLGEHAVLVVQPNSDGTANVVAVLPEANNPVIEALYKCIAREALKAKVLEEMRAKEAAVNKAVGQSPAANADQQRLAA